ncbi:MAG: DUF4367 domain-containing protein [Oscillospiraceae bacterium]|nr:DUF4367 domain-containing protein [Oscillospiraceae bacterium]
MTNQMTNNKIFDLIMADALADVWDMEFAKFDDGDTAEEFQVSDEFERNIRKIRNSIGRKERMKNAGRFSLKFFVTIATIMGVAFGGLLTQPTVYAAVQNVFRSIFSDHDKYTFSGEQQEDFTFDQNKRLGYIPDGYELRMVFYAENTIFTTYESIDEKNIEFDYGLANNSSISVDNERNTYYELNYNNVTYHYYEALNQEADYNTLIWYSDGYCFSIVGHLSKDEIIKAAENIITV